jgi:hypothetical protein
MTSKHTRIDSDFAFRVLPVIEKRVFRMGMAGNCGIDSSGIKWAAEHGANYWVWATVLKRLPQG